MPIMNREWYLKEAARLRARADEMERIAQAARPDNHTEPDAFVCAACGYFNPQNHVCYRCGKHELIAHYVSERPKEKLG